MSSTSLTVSVQQIATTTDPAANLKLVQDAIRRGAASGARVVVLPEASLVRFGAAPAAHAEPINGPWAATVQELAKELGVIVLVGTFQPAADGRVKNTILVTGEGIHSGYDKIHLYDAYGFSESADVEPGIEPFTFDVDGITVGVATCYDVRFPELFRELADRGAQIIIVTAHWGAGEGKIDAWRLLNQARAIDSTTWVIACDQADASTAGIEEPAGPRFGVGHSLVISPMGVVVEELDDKVGELLVTADIAAVEKAREVIPVLANRRLGAAL
ncbi:putative amidohydrolase [Paenarthrobacter nicotinovorans]|uniref:carbon-nitrogen hydrolase family protein n=1 Tax=Paenarthrobacter nicotinovorans TaxID=29320 RepID=UPI00278B6D8F|nr:carbon-nitrogen hydrolase family protein [Paenarthrobacter nicotinovorans]MDP9936775.1 putative amidohydrolase [Paenarthrobacter nicotinovorans]